MQKILLLLVFSTFPFKFGSAESFGISQHTQSALNRFALSVICELERDANAPFTPVSNSTKLPFNIGKNHPFLGNGHRQQVSATICCR